MVDTLNFLLQWIDIVLTLINLWQKWIPSIKEQWLIVKTSAEPHLQTLTTKTIDSYESSKSALAPPLVKVQEVVDPYFQVFYFICFLIFADNLHPIALSFVCRKPKSSASHILIRLQLWQNLMLTKCRRFWNLIRRRQFMFMGSSCNMQQNTISRYWFWYAKTLLHSLCDLKILFCFSDALSEGI